VTIADEQVRRHLRMSVPLRSVGLFCAGMATISGHVGNALGLFGPLLLLPTIALGLTVLCFVLLQPRGDGGGKALLLVMGALIVTAPGFVWAGDHLYATEKVNGLLTILLPLIVVVSILIRHPDDLRVFWMGVLTLAIIGVLVGFFEIVSGVDIGQRGSDNDGSLNPIAAGRLGGTVIIAMFFGKIRAIPFPAQAGLVVCGAGVLLGAASRGPLLALILAIGLTAAGYRAWRGKVALVAMAVGIAMTAGVGNLVLKESGDRLLDSGNDGGGSGRSSLWALAFEKIQIFPQGVGWGQFSDRGTIGAPGEYPHNFFLELGLEAGVIAMVTCILFVWFTFRMLWKSMGDVGPMVFALVAFWLITAQFSSDMNGNRVFVVALFGSYAAFRSGPDTSSEPGAEFSEESADQTPVEASKLRAPVPALDLHTARSQLAGSAIREGSHG
jgi:hypothetical protein